MFEFYFSPNLYQDSSWILDLVITLIGTFVGAAFGFWSALYIQKKQEKKLSLQKLQLFSTLSNDVLKSTKTQVDKYSILTKNISKEPYEYHLPIKPATEDLERLHSLLKGEILSPLAQIMGTKSDDYYKNIRKTIDYIFLTYKEIFDMNQKHIDFTYTDQCYVRDAVDEIINILIRRTEIIKTSVENYNQNPEYEYLIKLPKILGELSEESKKKKNSNLEGYKSKFLEEILTAGRLKIEQSVYLEFVNIIKPALNRLEKIKNNSEVFITDCDSYCKTISEQLTELESINKSLSDILNESNN